MSIQLIGAESASPARFSRGGGSGGGAQRFSGGAGGQRRSNG